jgi:hypothetical protein
MISQNFVEPLLGIKKKLPEPGLRNTALQTKLWQGFWQFPYLPSVPWYFLPKYMIPVPGFWFEISLSNLLDVFLNTFLGSVILETRH